MQGIDGSYDEQLPARHPQMTNEIETIVLTDLSNAGTAAASNTKVDMTASKGSIASAVEPWRVYQSCMFWIVTESDQLHR